MKEVINYEGDIKVIDFVKIIATFKHLLNLVLFVQFLNGTCGIKLIIITTCLHRAQQFVCRHACHKVLSYDLHGKSDLNQ